MQPSVLSPPVLSADAALFLDFDGCLVDIAPRPDAVEIPDGLARRLDRLHERLNGAVALVSGRDIADLRSWLPDFPGVIAGSHGAELSLDGRTIQSMHGIDLDVTGLHADAARAVAGHPAILVEPKPHGVALHYRADPSLRGVVEAAMADLARAHPGMILQAAKMAVELRPGGTGKGGAVERLMASPPFAGRTPVYAGDDLTDEEAMAVAQDQGGFGVKIGAGETLALYRLPDPAALAQWLDRGLHGGA